MSSDAQQNCFWLKVDFHYIGNIWGCCLAPKDGTVITYNLKNRDTIRQIPKKASFRL